MAVQSPLIRFYAGTGTDDLGRSLQDVLGWHDDRLEDVHDYIQWLFPLPEPSAFNAAAPILTPADIAAFAGGAELRSRLLAAFRRILSFYGFALGGDEAAPAVAKADNFGMRAAVWLTPGNHNFLRITRILQCLSLLGLAAQARAFLGALETLYAGKFAAVIGARTMQFWRNAA